MSEETPPTFQASIFNQSFFNDENITTAFLNANYLKFPIAQTATETIANLIATNLTATNDATVNGLTIGKGGGTIGTSTALGAQALIANTSGVANTSIGYQSLRFNTTGQDNISVGSETMKLNTDGNANVAIGVLSLKSNISGSNNTVVGYSAGSSSTVSFLTAIGSGSLAANTTGTFNTAVGYQALTNNISGSNNSAFGFNALKYSTSSSNTALGRESLASNTSGSENTAVGYESLEGNISGSKNTVVGYQAFKKSTGSNNTALGWQAGAVNLAENITGSDNTYIGYRTQATASNYSNSTALGAGAIITGSNQVVLGRSTETVIVPNILTVTNDATISGLTVGKGRGSITNNTSVGLNVLVTNTDGTNNTGVGHLALRLTTTGGFNTGVGSQALTDNTTGAFNTAVGYESLFLNTTSSNNSAVGYKALKFSTGSNNTVLGYQVLTSNTTGSNNTAVGFEAGFAGTANTTGSNNTYIGYNAQSNANNYSNSTALGAGAIITGSNQVVLGTSSETVSVPGNFSSSELSVGTNLFSNNTISNITPVLNIADDSTVITNTSLITTTVPIGAPRKKIEFSFPTSYQTTYTKSTNGVITYTYGYDTSTTVFKLYKNSIFVQDLTAVNDAPTSSQNVIITATGVSPSNSIGIWRVFLGNLSGSFTTDYDTATQNIYIVKLTFVNTSTFTATGTGVNVGSESVVLNTSSNGAFVSSGSAIFVITTLPVSIIVPLEKYVYRTNPLVGTTQCDTLITNDIEAGLSLVDVGFNGFSPFPKTSDNINLTGSLNITKGIISPSLYSASSSSFYDYANSRIVSITNTPLTNGNVSITRNSTVSNNTAVLLGSASVPQAYQNTSFSFQVPLTFLTTFSSVTTAVHIIAPTWVNTQSINWTSTSYQIYKNSILWKTIFLTVPSGGISSVVVSVSPNQPTLSTYTYSYTVFIGNAIGSFTPDYNYSATADVYTVYLKPSMTFQSNQPLPSTVVGTFTLGIMNTTSTVSYAVSGANIVYTPANFATGYSIRTTTEDIFPLTTVSGKTILDEVRGNSLEFTSGAFSGVVSASFVGNLTGTATSATSATTATIATTATTATNVTATAVNTNSNFSVPFLSAATGSVAIRSDSDITYNPSTETLETGQYGFNYTALPIVGKLSTSLGYTLSISRTTNFNMASASTTYNILSFSLPVGGWLITLKGEIAQNANFANFMRVGISSTSATFNNDYKTIVFCENAHPDPIFSTMFYYSNIITRTVYWVASPQGDAFQIKTGAEMLAVRLH